MKVHQQRMTRHQMINGPLKLLEKIDVFPVIFPGGTLGIWMSEWAYSESGRKEVLRPKTKTSQALHVQPWIWCLVCGRQLLNDLWIKDLLKVSKEHLRSWGGFGLWNKTCKKMMDLISLGRFVSNCWFRQPFFIDSCSLDAIETNSFVSLSSLLPWKAKSQNCFFVYFAHTLLLFKARFLNSFLAKCIDFLFITCAEHLTVMIYCISGILAAPYNS